MGQQIYSDESNWKHEPHTKHFEDDKFEKGSTNRTWKKHIDRREVEEDPDLSSHELDRDKLIRKSPSK